MRNMMILLLLVVLAVSNIAAADEFMPRKLEIMGWDEIRFRHDLDKQEILVRVTGGDATVFFAVFSKDEYNNIGNTNSNYMPWHTVNKIDTCVYISPPYFMTEGDHVIEWDGRSSEGEVLHYGDPRHGKPSFYYYYLWGVDTNSRKQLVSRDIQITSGGGIIQTQDYEGDPIAQAVILSER